MEKAQEIKAFDRNEFTARAKCEGCSAFLQNDRLDKYGFIEKEAMLEAIAHNQKVIEKQFERTDSTLKSIREVEGELGLKILREEPGPLLNLDNLEVLMRL